MWCSVWCRLRSCIGSELLVLLIPPPPLIDEKTEARCLAITDLMVEHGGAVTRVQVVHFLKEIFFFLKDGPLLILVSGLS